VDRGGDVTYHGPGQLVGYPLLPLGRPVEKPGGPARLPQADYVGYVRKLEQVIIAALGELGVRGEQLEGLTGVWARVGGRSAKIAAIGVKVDARGVSRHGFALNVDPEMRYWEGIIGCGLQDYASTSLAEISHPAPEMERVRALVSASFGQIFDYKMEKSTQSWRTV
jgi:lipoyl(octanoyl) transferase